MFYKGRERLSHCLLVILQLYLRLNKKQKWKYDSMKNLLKILTPKQMLQMLPIALVKVKQVMNQKTY